MKDIKEFTDKYMEAIVNTINSPLMQAVFFKICPANFSDHKDEEITEQKILELQDDFHNAVIAMMLTDKESPISKDFATVIYHELRNDTEQN